MPILLLSIVSYMSVSFVADAAGNIFLWLLRHAGCEKDSSMLGMGCEIVVAL